MYDNDNRLLIVDSDPHAVSAVRRVGEELGFSVFNAAERMSFLRLVEDARPTVILLDMELPQLDGVESMRALAARGVRATVALMGQSDRRVMNATRSIGFSRGLTMARNLAKPLEEDELRGLLLRLKCQERRFSPLEIKAALDAGQFIAYYQPQVSMVNTDGWIIDGVEALVRWQHPSLGIVMPNEFIPQAEKSGLIGRLTERVLNQALEQLSQWHRAGLTLRCSVNLPASLVTDLDFPDRVAESIAEYGVEASQVTLELTETATMQDPTSAMDILTRLRVKGIGLSLDDFGTGYSSLTRLYQMPFDEMKLDRSLAMNVPGSNEALIIIRSLIDLAHNLGLTVCTEGIETREALDLLASLHSDRCQGYFISRALPPTEIANFVPHWNAQSPASVNSVRVKQVHAVL